MGPTWRGPREEQKYVRNTCQDSAQRQQGAIVLVPLLIISGEKKIPFREEREETRRMVCRIKIIESVLLGAIGSRLFGAFSPLRYYLCLWIFLGVPLFHCSYSVHPDWYQLFNLSPGDLILFLIWIINFMCCWIVILLSTVKFDSILRFLYWGFLFLQL